MRIRLYPPIPFATVDVVAVELLQTTVEYRSFAIEKRVVPVRIKVKDFIHLHCIDQVTREAIPPPRASSDDPVADPRFGPDAGLACRQRARPKEWVGRETVITRHDVREESHEQV